MLKKNNLYYTRKQIISKPFNTQLNFMYRTIIFTFLRINKFHRREKIMKYLYLK